MVKNYLIALVIVIGISNCSTNKVFHYYTINVISNDIEQVNNSTIMILKPFLADNNDSIVVKNVHITFTNHEDSIITELKDEYVVKSNTELVPNTEYEIITSTFNAYSNEVFFKGKYWAKINFEYLLQDSLYTQYSNIEFDRRE